MMGKKDYSERSQVQIASLDDLVPSGHLVRKLEEAIDLSFIYDEVKDLYKPYGRESIDPVVLMKIVILQYVFGIPSMRKTIKEIEVNLAYRWYLGYGLYEDIPHFSTFGKNYTRRFKDTDLFQKIFSRILMEVDACGFLDTESLFIDGTHIKASANPHKYQNETMEKEARCYEKELQEEIEKDRLEHGKKPLKEKESTPETINKKVSTTDPDSGWFHKGEHKQVFAYAANTCCDKNNYVIDFEVTAGNVHDSVSFWELYRKVSERVKYPKYYVMDAGYKIPAIARTLIEEGKVPVMPYKRPMTKKGYFRKSDYVYDEYFDCYLCPNNQILKYSTTNRDGYREYKSDGKKCKDCPYQNQCTGSKDHVKVVSRHVWEGYMEKVEEIRHQTGMKEIYQKRKETIERVFADGKEKHGMRYTQYRGLAKVTMELTLLFACMNLKKLAIWKWRKGGLRKPCSFVCIFEPIYLYIKFKMVPGASHQEPFCLQSEPGLPFGIQVKILIPFDYSFFSIQPIKVLTFSSSSSFMVLSFSHNSRYEVFASSSGAKNSAGVISKYEMILNSSLRDGKAAPLVIPRMYEPLLSKSKLILCSEIFFAILNSVILIRINSSYCVLAIPVPPSSTIVV